MCAWAAGLGFGIGGHDDDVDIGHFIAENVQTIAEIADTRTIITFKAF